MSGVLAYHDGVGGWVLGRRGEIEGGAALRK